MAKITRSICVLIVLGFPFPRENYATQLLTTETIVDRAMPATVTILVSTPEGEKQGSGFLIDNTGTVVTNNHVIRDASSGRVAFPDGTFLPGFQILSTDEEHDLALIQISGTDYPYLNLGDSDSVRVGQEVTAIGAPYGFESTVSTGIISAIRMVEGWRLLQLTAPISPGSSGGPIIARSGKVIGVAVLQFTEGQNLNFAVPINYVRELLARSEAEKAVSIAPLAEVPSEILRYGESPRTYTYQRSQQDFVIQTVGGQDQQAEVKSYWRFTVRFDGTTNGELMAEVIHDSVTIKSLPKSDTDVSGLYGKGLQIFMTKRGTVSDIVVPRGTSQSLSRLDLAATYRAFFPVLPPSAVRVGDIWSDTVNFQSRQSGLDMTVERVNHYRLRGGAENAGRMTLQVEYTADVRIKGSGTQQGSDILLEGVGTGTGSFYFLPNLGLYMGGTETSEVNLTAFVVSRGQSLLIPIVQRREESVELIE